MGKKVHFLLVLSVSVAVISISVLFINTAVARQNPPSGPPQPTLTADSLSEKQILEIQKIIEDYLDRSGVASLNGHLQFQVDTMQKQANENINRANDQLKWMQLFIVAIGSIFSVVISYGAYWVNQTVKSLIESEGNKKADKLYKSILKTMNKEGNKMLNDKIQQDSIYGHDHHFG